ncbi:hypothetical protein J2810_003979 [Chryseobacterium rhizosphaerae]|uniref:TIR domain-containing protein n=1 Tax=Chryseobacterium rhizosphaerae TaxID=395937 RepID=UPI0028542097|nr:TIR domain-containing protein [Chryseobacterium rhizosphaerae]MDR6547893.1 hypothetical protein [Chryseobacterium rhizosphaerae]
MNIFISWSGETSMKIAEELKNWIPKVLQSAKPYYTPSDIEKGTRWETEINQKLSECLVGLICLTSNNTEKPWILFEAGALSNRLDKSKVCPILFGLKKSDVTGPLARFQLTDFNKIDFLKLLQSINTSLEENAIPSALLSEVFETFYPKFEETVNTILTSENNSVSKPKRTDRSILEEILDLVRKQNNTKESAIFQMHEIIPKYNKNKLSLPTQEPSKDLDIGTFVSHPQYGIGIIQSIQRLNEKEMLGIKFEENVYQNIENDGSVRRLI